VTYVTITELNNLSATFAVTWLNAAYDVRYPVTLLGVSVALLCTYMLQEVEVRALSCPRQPCADIPRCSLRRPDFEDPKFRWTTDGRLRRDEAR
jgi:hypothetical protein